MSQCTTTRLNIPLILGYYIVETFLKPLDDRCIEFISHKFTSVVYVTPLTDIMVYVFSDSCHRCSIVIHYNYVHANSLCLHCLGEFCSYIRLHGLWAALPIFVTSMRSVTLIGIKLTFSTVLNSYRLSTYNSSHVSNHHTSTRIAVIGTACASLLSSHLILEHSLCPVSWLIMFIFTVWSEKYEHNYMSMRRVMR